MSLGAKIVAFLALIGGAILAFLAALIGAKRAGKAEAKQEQAEKSLTQSRESNEIRESVRDLSDDSLSAKLRKYKRD